MPYYVIQNRFGEDVKGYESFYAPNNEEAVKHAELETGHRVLSVTGGIIIIAGWSEGKEYQP
jgi:hypothetical protein